MNIFKKIILENPVLETENLIISINSLKEEVFIDLFEIYGSEENLRNYIDSTYPSLDFFRSSLIDKIYDHQIGLGGFIQFLIQDKVSGKYIGVENLLLDGMYTHLGDSMISNDKVIIEVILNKNFWNKGYYWETRAAIDSYVKTKGIKYALGIVSKENFKIINAMQSRNVQAVSEEKVVKDFGFHKDFDIHSSNKTSILYVMEL